MKTKKALKKLDKIQAILSTVIDQHAGADGSLRELLDSAKETVSLAKAKVNGQEEPKSRRKTAAVERKSNRSGNGTGKGVAKTA